MSSGDSNVGLISIIVAVIGTVIGSVIGILTYRSKEKESHKLESETDAKVNSEILLIKQRMDYFERDLKDLRESLKDIGEDMRALVRMLK